MTRLPRTEESRLEPELCPRGSLSRRSRREESAAGNVRRVGEAKGAAGRACAESTLRPRAQLAERGLWFAPESRLSDASDLVGRALIPRPFGIVDTSSFKL